MGSPATDPHRWIGTLCAAMAASVALVAAAAYVLAPSFAGDRPAPIVLWALVLAAALALLMATVTERVLTDRPPAPGETAAQSAARAKLVGFALREATGLIGGVLTFLTGDRLFAVTLGGFSLLAMFLAWPTRDPASPPRS